jgi:hypothetical protein
MPSGDSAAGAETAVVMLEALGAELDGSGLRARLLIRAGAAPVLHVSNPAAAHLSERICAAPLEGTRRYWWSWAEPIDTAAAGAAARIGRVLCLARTQS